MASESGKGDQSNAIAGDRGRGGGGEAGHTESIDNATKKSYKSHKRTFDICDHLVAKSP